MKRLMFLCMMGICALLLFPRLTLPVAAQDAEAGGAAEAETQGAANASSLEEWLGVSVLPSLISTAVVIGTATLELIPAVRSLGRAKRQFETVAERADAYTQAKIAYDVRAEERENALNAQAERIRAESEARTRQWEERLATCLQEQEEALAHFREQASEYRAALDACEARLACLIERAADSADKTKRMVYLGMTNSGELVTNGAARKIAEVEEETDAC